MTPRRTRARSLVWNVHSLRGKGGNPNMRATRWITSGMLGAVLVFGAPAGVLASTPDAWITTKAKMSLYSTEGVSGNVINVDTVDGRVTLHGKVNSADEKIWRARQQNEPAGSGGFTGGARDTYITSAVKLRLLADSRTPALDINVDTRDGDVILFGIVPSAEAKAAAAENARKVSGVK